MLIEVGYWRGPEADETLPDAADFVDESWDPDERDLVELFLSSGLVAAACMGFSHCRFCGVQNGNLDLTDGHYVWPEGLAHYVREHQVRMPEPFVRHAIATSEALETAERESYWWRGQTGFRMPPSDHLQLLLAAANRAADESTSPWSALMREMLSLLSVVDLPDEVEPAARIASTYWSGTDGDPQDLAAAKSICWDYLERFPAGEDVVNPEGRRVRALLCVLDPAGDDEAASDNAEWFISMIGPAE